MLSVDVIKYHLIPFLDCESLYCCRRTNKSFFQAYLSKFHGLLTTKYGKAEIFAIALQYQDQELLQCLFKNVEIDRALSSAIFPSFQKYEKNSQNILSEVSLMIIDVLWTGEYLTSIPRILIYGKNIDKKLPIDIPNIVTKTLSHVINEPYYPHQKKVHDSLISTICPEIASFFGYRYIGDILGRNPKRFADVYSQVLKIGDPRARGYIIDRYLELPSKDTGRLLSVVHLFSNSQSRERILEVLELTQ